MTTSVAKSYDTYIDSGTEWLGKVPAHWRIARIKDVFQVFGSGTTPSSSEPTYYDDGSINWLNTADLNNWIVCDTRRKVTPKALAETALKVYPKGSLAIAMYGQGDTRGNVGLLAIEASSNQAALVMYRSFNSIPKYMLWWFVSRKYSIRQINTGATQPNMNQDFVRNLIIALPPLAEQQAIAAYLDAKTAQIDRKIDLLTQKAAKYRQLKQSLINEAVTRGLDKSAPMKDSGIGWIGEVPAHWRIVRLKDVAELRYSNVDKLSKEDEVSVALCNYVDVYRNDFIDASLPLMTATANAAEIKRFSLRQHDVLVTKDSETADDIAVPALVLETLPGVLCGYHLAQLRSRKEVMHGPYLFRLFQADNYGHRFVTHAKGITRVGLSMSAFADALTPVPPYDEQMAISKHIDAKAVEIDDLIAVIGHQIDKLKELRKALINDVVTGKLRVA